MVFFTFKVADKILYFRKFPQNHSSIKVLEMLFIIRLTISVPSRFEAYGSSFITRVITLLKILRP